MARTRGYGVTSGLVLLVTLLAILWLAFPSAVDEARSAPGPSRQSNRAAPTRRVPAVNDVARFLAARAQGERSAVLRSEAAREQQAIADLVHQDLWLHAVGAQLYTAWGQPATLKAINWYGFEYAPFVPGGLDRAPLDTILASLRRLGFNALRITFADQTVESNPVVRRGLDANPSLRGLHALDIMQRILQRARVFGLRVILCNSRSEAGRGPEILTGLWYTKQYPESSWVADWELLARRFRNESAFVGADLRNEPHLTGGVFTQAAYFRLGPLWGAYHGIYYHDRDWHYAAQTLGNDLLAINPHLLIIVEGVQIYLDPYRNVMTGGLWGANLEGVQYDPVVLSRPGQLVYSVHEYGPQMWQAGWFNPHTTYASLSRRWDRLWGYLLTAQKALQTPIFVGEFGTCHQYWACIASNEGWKQGFWFQSFVRYLSLHPEVGWAYWALNPDGPFNPGDTNFYSLVSPDWRHYFPLVPDGLRPLLREPDGLWNSTVPATAKGPAMTPQPGCLPFHSCTRAVPVPLRSVRGKPWQTAPAKPVAVHFRPSVPYVSWPDPARSGNLYLPEGTSAARPAIIVVHGPSWEAGTDGTPATANLAARLAWHGYVVYDINYRLAPGAGQYPRNIRDVKAAAAFLAAQSTRLHIDPARIAIVGSGAGGYLAMMAAYTGGSGFFAPETGGTVPPIAAVGALFAPVDLQGIAAAGSDATMITRLRDYLGYSYAARQVRYEAASPKSYVGSATPTIFFTGINDVDEPFAQTFSLYRYLKQRSLTSELIDLPGAPQSYTDLNAGTRTRSFEQLVDFFDGIFYQPPITP